MDREVMIIQTENYELRVISEATVVFQFSKVRLLAS